MAEYKQSRKFRPIRKDGKFTHVNYGMGCTNGCAYCIQQKDLEYNHGSSPHDFSVDSLVEQLERDQLVSRKQPLVIGNATDPFLKRNLDHTKGLLRKLDRKRYKSPLAIITKTYPDDRFFFGNSTLRAVRDLRHLKPVILVSYVGYKDRKLERVSGESRLQLMKEASQKYKIPTILYCRPLVKAWMDEDGESHEEKIERIANETKGIIDAVVFGGLYYPEEVRDEIMRKGLKEPFDECFSGKRLDDPGVAHKLKKTFNKVNPEVPVFRSTSCGVSYVNGTPCFFGYYGLRSLERDNLECNDSCNDQQRDLCRTETKKVSWWQVRRTLREIGLKSKFKNHPLFVRVYDKLEKDQRYYLRHNLCKFVLDDTEIGFWKDWKDKGDSHWKRVYDNLVKLGFGIEEKGKK